MNNFHSNEDFSPYDRGSSIDGYDSSVDDDDNAGGWWWWRCNGVAAHNMQTGRRTKFMESEWDNSK